MSEFSSSEQLQGGSGGFSSLLKKWRAGILSTASSRPVPGQITAKSTTGTVPRQSGGGLSSLPSSLRPTSDTGMATSPSPSSEPTKPSQEKKQPYRIAQFETILLADSIDLAALRKLAWNGIPAQYRTMVWQLQLGYMPTSKSRREQAITRKRKEYFDSVKVYFENSDTDFTSQNSDILHQILVDLPRTSPNIPFFQQAPIQKALERILFIWAIRHPACGYVQGMNDLLTPMLYVNMSPYVPDVLRCDLALVSQESLMNMEADSYWCLTKLLDNIQDHYTSSQPGLQRMVLRLEDLVHRIDKTLHDHFEAQGLQYIQFSFRWMNCLLLRDLPLKAILRVWDTYMSEERGGFENFHVYVCTVLLKSFKEKLMLMDFQDALMFLQDMPTWEWGEDEVEPILSQAFILSTLFEDSPSHLG